MAQMGIFKDAIFVIPTIYLDGVHLTIYIYIYLYF